MTFEQEDPKDKAAEAVSESQADLNLVDLLSKDSRSDKAVLATASSADTKHLGNLDLVDSSKTGASSSDKQGPSDSKVQPVAAKDNGATTDGAMAKASNDNPNDHGRWVTDRLGPSFYQPSASETAGHQVAQILLNPNATDADRQRAAAMIMNSPNPEHAVYTANNGYPVTQAFLGLFGGQNTPALSGNGLELHLHHRTVNVPPQGEPSHAGYRPGYSMQVPSALTLRRR